MPMYRSVITILLSSLFFIVNVSAQHHCGGVVGDVEAFNDRLLQNVKTAKVNSKQKSNKETVYIPVKFHLVAESDGRGRISFNSVFDELCTLNTQFEPLGMIFYIKDGFNSIDHTPTYESPRSAGATSRMIQEKNREGSEAINIFITQNADIGNSDFGTTLGFYENRNDYVVIRKSQIGNGGSTMAHELGHLFSLNHPHYGWEDQPWELEIHGRKVTKSTVSSSQSGRSIRVELVDGSNCDSSGDNICDTPPDYNFGFSWDRSCPKFNTVVLDKNSDTIVPMQNNYMSYFLGCDPYVFTQDQANVIIADYNSNDRSNIRSGYIPNDEMIENVLVLESPANNTTADFYNGVALDWSDVPGAESYFLNITGGGDDLRIISDQSIYYVTDLAPNTVYTWSVTPFNETGGCGVKKSAIIRTNDAMTATKDPALDGSISINPNPVFRSEFLNIHIVSEEYILAKYIVTSLDGKTVINNQMIIKQGTNSLQLSIANASPGVYLFSLVTEKGVTTKKIILQ